jgi:hypothetical protein
MVGFLVSWLEAYGLIGLVAVTPKKAKKMTAAEKYADLKRQTEQAGMSVTEKDGKLMVSRKKKTGKRAGG